MMIVRKSVLSFAVAVLAVSVAHAAPPTGIDGVWTVTKVVTTPPDPAAAAGSPGGIMMFDRGHYSLVMSSSERQAAPPPTDPTKLTDADRLAKFGEWEPLTAQAGTYEVKGAVLLRRAKIAKNVQVMMAANPVSQGFRLVGNTLELTSRSPTGSPPRVSVMTLTRVR